MRTASVFLKSNLSAFTFLPRGDENVLTYSYSANTFIEVYIYFRLTFCFALPLFQTWKVLYIAHDLWRVLYALLPFLKVKVLQLCLSVGLNISGNEMGYPPINSSFFSVLSAFTWLGRNRMGVCRIKLCVCGKLPNLLIWFKIVTHNCLIESV